MTLELIERLSSATAVAFSRQHLANTVWAYATVEYEGSSYFLGKLAKALTLRAGDCNPQEISNTVWAFAKLRELLIHPEAKPCICDNFLEHASKSQVSHSDENSDLHYVTYKEAWYWNYSILHCQQNTRPMSCTSLLYKKQWLPELPVFSPHSCQTLLLSSNLCKLQNLQSDQALLAGHYDTVLLDRMATEAAAQIENFSQQNLANLAWAYGKLSHFKASLMASVAHQAVLKSKVKVKTLCIVPVVALKLSPTYLLGGAELSQPTTLQQYLFVQSDLCRNLGLLLLEDTLLHSADGLILISDSLTHHKFAFCRICLCSTSATFCGHLRASTTCRRA